MRPPEDLRQTGQRRLLAAELSRKYPFSPAVLKAVEQVPRHLFVERDLAHLAYKDKPLSIGNGQTISQPYTVAMQTHLLDCSKMNK
ncbi:MAG TPA: hypothetical protein PL119_04515, partial [Bacteroidales bacterium]|nr:hypothetical protein [Bacteroidales bacterium]